MSGPQTAAWSALVAIAAAALSGLAVRRRLDHLDLVAVLKTRVFRRGEDWAVFAVARGRATLREVGIGRRNGSHAEVLSGLVEGTTVVLYPSDALEDGSRVAQRAPSPG